MKSIGRSLTLKQYRSFLLGNIHQGYKDFVQDEQEFLTFSRFRKEHFIEYYHPPLFVGIAQALKKLSKNFILTIASSGNQDSVEEILKKIRLIIFLPEYTRPQNTPKKI